MKKNKKKYIFYICLIAVIIVCVICIIIQSISGQVGKQAVVKVDGETVCIIDLNKNQTVYINGSNNIKLEIICENNSIYVNHSDCPDKICEQKGKISSTNQNIICLPAKTVIEIIGNESSRGDIDAAA